MERAEVKTAVRVESYLTDKKTGEYELMNVNNITYLANSKEEFYLMYSSMVLILKSSKDVRTKLFGALLERYSRGQEFSMTKAFKELIANETGCKARSLDSAFTYLVKNSIVVKIGQQLYRVNPRHIFQGSHTDRNNSLKSILELHCKTC